MSIAGVDHWHTRRHVEAFTAAGLRVVSVQGDEPESAKSWADHLDCRVAPDLDALLDDAADVVLALPRHRDGPAVVARLVDSGLPFVVEKPVAASAADLWPHVVAVEASRQFAAVPFINRHSTFWHHLARVQADGLLVPPSIARFRIVNGPPSRYVDDGVAWVLDPVVGGGGALRNLGPHPVDAFLSLAQGPVTVTGAALSHRQYGLDVEEHAIALLEDGAGLVGVVEAGYSGASDQGTDHEWSVAGPGATVREHDSVVTVGTRDGQTRTASPSVMHRYHLFAEDIVERLRTQQPAPVTLRDAWRALDVIDRIYDTARGAPLGSATDSEGEGP